MSIFQYSWQERLVHLFCSLDDFCHHRLNRLIAPRAPGKRRRSRSLSDSEIMTLLVSFHDKAQRGKTSVGWFYGFKLHLVINHQGELLGAKLTPGNVHDTKPAYDLLARLTGRTYADRGYLSKLLQEQLGQVGVSLITKVKKNMKPQELSPEDELFLCKRGLIETVIDQIKNQSQVQHTRHRADTGFLSNVLGALIAYCHQNKKPTIDIS